ncbi:MAG: bifunctional riboflavin kinase/FAD synthetase [Clostridia bacterium]|nr:bifunctional riboflavin kinase/FAD synthetase [Clostridia bacterium]
MQIITNPHDISDCALALGNFDGLHIAHIKILNECVSYGKKSGLKSGVLLFDLHTEAITENKTVKLLTPLKEKLDIISSETDLDFVFIQNFDKEFMRLSPTEFFKYLTAELNVSAIFAGFDYTFGYKASGNSSLLKEMGAENNIYVNIINEIDVDSVPVSSTLIRNMIIKGELYEVQKYLGRLYTLSGEVVYGKQNGRKIGLPTANVSYDKNKLLPPDGVYAGYVLIGNKKYNSLINIGKNPTFNADTRTVEAHIADFSDNIYGRFITIQFVRKIRDEKKFTSPKELKLQIESDLISSGVKK